MSQTPKKRKLSQTPEAKKARSERAKRSAATRKYNEQAKAALDATFVPARKTSFVDAVDVSSLKDKIDEEPFKDSIDTPASSPVAAHEREAKEALRVIALSAENERLRDRLADLEAEKWDRESPVEAAPVEFEPPRPVQVARVVRNLRSAVIHLTLTAPNSEKLFRLNLRPRGERGDAQAVPYGYQHDPQFQGSVGVLFEVITQTEARDLAYGPAGYNPHHRAGVTVTRDVDNTKVVGRVDVGGEKGTRVSMTRAQEQPLPGEIAPDAVQNPDSEQEQYQAWLASQREFAASQLKRAQEERAEESSDRPHGANPTFANVPGSDTGLQDGLNAASASTTVTQEESFTEEVIGPEKVARELSEQQRRMIALTEQAERAERAKISKLERDGILPPGALNQRVTIVRSGG